MRILMDLCYYAVAISFYQILFLHAPALGGWNENQAMVFVSGYLIVDAICMTLFANNLWIMPTLINRGDLDYYLIRPVSGLFFISLREITTSSFVNLVCAVGIFVWALARLDQPYSFLQVVVFLFLLGCGALIFFCLNGIANLLVFWTHAPSGFGELVWSLNKFAERPDRIFRGVTRIVLLVALPFSVLCSYPARILIEGIDLKIVAHVLGVLVLFLGLYVGVWRLGLRTYSSASS
jgi:ABC-2 type transport system permease protein